MLWNVVFEFFVKYIFGGVLYDANQGILYFNGFINRFAGETPVNTASLNVSLFGVSIAFGNYLSLIATIISMVVILVLCCALIKKIYNICAHVIC